MILGTSIHFKMNLIVSCDKMHASLLKLAGKTFNEKNKQKNNQMLMPTNQSEK